MRDRHHTTTAQSAPSRLRLFVVLAILPVIVGGCGSTAGSPAAEATSAMAVQAVTTTSTPKSAPTFSLHERIMAEQGRGAGTAAAGTGLSAAPAAPDLDAAGDPQPPATAPGLAGGVPDPSPARTDAAAATAVVLTEGQTPLVGVWGGTAEQLASFLSANCPSPRFTVAVLDLAGYYVRYCAEAGLRADVLWAQMALETGYGAYGGDVSPQQNNFAGIGATGGGVAGVSFATAEAGVMAQVAHMVAYVYVNDPVQWANSTTDPRYDLVSPRGAAAVLADLNGRWAVPGTTYGQHIEDIVRRINSSVK